MVMSYSPEQVAAQDAFLSALSPADTAYLLDLIYQPFPVLPSAKAADTTDNSARNTTLFYNRNFSTCFTPLHDDCSKDENNLSPTTSLSTPPTALGFTAEYAVAPSGREHTEKESKPQCGSWVFGTRYYCKQRLCPVCSRYRHYRMALNLIDYIINIHDRMSVSEGGHDSRYSENIVGPAIGDSRDANTVGPAIPAIYSLTLTVPHTNGRLRPQLAALKSDFKHLRRLAAWKSVEGGVWFMDCTYNAVAQQWHPHLHLIVETTADTFNVDKKWGLLTDGLPHWNRLQPTYDDVKRLSNYHTMPAHLKDAGKGETFTSSPELLREYAQAVKGQQVYRSFGSWKDCKLRKRYRPVAR